MHKLMLWTVTVFLSALLTVPLLAAESDSNQPAAVPQTTDQGGGETEGTVPQAQSELMKSREDARKRRDELLKMRQQTIDAAGQGDSSADQQTLPASQ